MIKALLKQNTSWSSIGEIWLKGTMLVVTIIIARSLGASVFGIYTFIIALVQIFQILIDFGLPLIAVRDLTLKNTPADKYLGNIIFLKIFFSLLSLLIISALIPILNKPTEIIWLIYAQTFYIILYSFAGFLVSVFRAREKFKYEALVKIITGIFILPLIIYLARFHSIKLFIYAFVLVGIITVVLTIFIIIKKFNSIKLNFDKNILKNTIKDSWPLALAGLFGIVYFRIDAVMLSYLQGDQPTGWYNAAYQLIYTLIFIPAFVMMSFYPRLTKLIEFSYEKAKKLYKQSLSFIGLMGLVLMASLYLLAQPIISITYGNSFEPSVKVLQILTIAVLLSFFAHVWLFTLTALKKQKIYTWAVGIGMIVNIILNWIYIPKYSLYAAAWTTVATEIFTGLIIFLACQKYLYKKTPNT